MGRFNYTHLPLPYYSLGIKKVALTPKQVVLMASPEKLYVMKLSALLEFY